MQNLTYTYPFACAIAAIGWRSSSNNIDGATTTTPRPQLSRRRNMVVGSRREKTLTAEETQFHHTQDGVFRRHSSDLDATQDDDDENDDSNKPNWNWDPYSVPNPGFDEYYKEQGIVAPEEWDTFIQFLRKPLPAAFRINASGRFFVDIRSQLENGFFRSSQNEYVARDEAWYSNFHSDNLAWYSNFSRKELRKNPDLERFHKFLKREDEIGNIARQEAVSMVPALLLDVHSEHLVLDMCASPGSKTYQLLEIIHRSTATGSLPDGLVVANDLGVKRCDHLIHKMKRMCTSNLIVTNHEAQCFPRCHSRHYANTLEMDSSMEPYHLNQLRFDLVLCDVPCSGDGTLRKAPQVWTMWNVGIGNGLHGLQAQIAMRGLSLLKVSGRMVYSTCSMNPVENEAVVAEVLRRCEGSVELFDVSGEIPQLVYRPGLKKWKVQDKGTWFATYKNVPRSRRGGVAPTMFPSGRNFADSPSNDYTPGFAEKSNSRIVSGMENMLKPVQQSHARDENMEEEVSNFPLEHCLRIMPHDQNSGAFFIAVFHKISPLPERYEKTTSVGGKLLPGDVELQENQMGFSQDVNAIEGSQVEGMCRSISPGSASAVFVEKSGKASESGFGNSNSDNDSADSRISDVSITDKRESRGKRKLQTQRRWWWIDPVVFLGDETIINSVRMFYGIDKSFPLNGHLVIRNADSNCGKRIYYISKSVKDILELNTRAGNQLKIFYVGLKMFERKKSRECSSLAHLFRITSEGLPVLLPYITKQILYASSVDFKSLLQYKSIRFSSFSDGEFGEKASQLVPGCCVVVLGTEGLSNSKLIDHSPIAIGCWKGKTCLNVMVSDIECQELLERIFLGTGD